MSKFNDIFSKIWQNLSISNVESTDFRDIELDEYHVVSENVINIVDEYVSDPELTPVPKDFLNVICERVKFRRNNVTIISMKELYSLLREYDYPYFQDFKTNLKNIETGNLYIVLLFDRDFSFKNNISIKFNSTYQFLNTYIQNETILSKLCEELLKDKFKYSDAICSKTDMDIEQDSFFQNNGLIYVSLKTEFVKDSLEHELTHFVQKVVGLNKSLSKIFTDPKFNTFAIGDSQAASNLLAWINEFTNGDEEKTIFLINFFKMKFKNDEIDQSIKAVLNGIQRIYEYQKFIFIPELSYSKKEIDKNEAIHNLDFRLNWLSNFFLVISSKEFMVDLNTIIENTLKDNEMQQYMMKYRSYFIVLLYFGFLKMFPNLDIRAKIVQHFKTFKFKDN